MITFLAVISAAIVLLVLVSRRSKAEVGVKGQPGLNKTAEMPVQSSMQQPLSSPTVSAAEPVASVFPDPRPVPEALQTLKLQTADVLDGTTLQSLMDRISNIPRPPRSFVKMVSGNALATATSDELADLVMSEPLIAAKVIARVNAPLYGLSKPVVNVGQAITFLGMNNVRAICVQYLLEESFKADIPQRQAIFDDIWTSSALASDLCFRLAQKLNLPNPGVLSTLTVLSYIGHIAAAYLLPANEIEVSKADLVERVRVEQASLGIAAGEISRLLMQAWALPDELVQTVSGIDRMLFSDADQSLDSHRMDSAVLCYLSARLGERLAHGNVAVPLSMEALDAVGDDFFHLAPRLRTAAFNKLPEALQAKDLNLAVETMLEGVGGSAHS